MLLPKNQPTLPLQLLQPLQRQPLQLPKSLCLLQELRPHFDHESVTCRPFSEPRYHQLSEFLPLGLHDCLTVAARLGLQRHIPNRDLVVGEVGRGDQVLQAAEAVVVVVVGHQKMALAVEVVEGVEEHSMLVREEAAVRWR